MTTEQNHTSTVGVALFQMRLCYHYLASDVVVKVIQSHHIYIIWSCKSLLRLKAKVLAHLSVRMMQRNDEPNRWSSGTRAVRQWREQVPSPEVAWGQTEACRFHEQRVQVGVLLDDIFPECPLALQGLRRSTGEPSFLLQSLDPFGDGFLGVPARCP